MFDSLDTQIELVFMMLPVPAVFRASIGEDSLLQERAVMEEREYAVVQKISGGKDGLSLVELRHGQFCIGIEKVCW